MNKNTLIAVVVVIALVLVAVGVVSNNTNTASTPTMAPASAGQQMEPVDEIALADEVNITVESNGLSFTPSTIKVKQNQIVNVTYKNNMGRHDWVVDEFGAKTQILEAGASETVSFRADKAGTFEFYCSVPGHREAGMKGSLIVE